MRVIARSLDLKHELTCLSHSCTFLMYCRFYSINDHQTNVFIRPFVCLSVYVVCLFVLLICLLGTIASDASTIIKRTFLTRFCSSTSKRAHSAVASSTRHRRGTATPTAQGSSLARTSSGCPARQSTATWTTLKTLCFFSFGGKNAALCPSMLVGRSEYEIITSYPPPAPSHTHTPHTTHHTPYTTHHDHDDDHHHQRHDRHGVACIALGAQ
jgi:hypothetical protein